MTATTTEHGPGLLRHEPMPSRSSYRRGADGDAEHALACYQTRVYNLSLDEMNSCAGMTPEKLAAIEDATGKRYTPEERAHILRWAELARSNDEFLARLGNATPEQREEIRRVYQAWLDEHLTGAADREAGREYTKTYAATHPDRVRLTISKKNLKNVLKSAERYRAAIKEFERVKALHDAAAPDTWAERHETVEVLAGGARFEREHLAEAEAAVAKWQAEIERLEVVVAAEKVAAKAHRAATKLPRATVKI